MSINHSNSNLLRDSLFLIDHFATLYWQVGMFFLPVYTSVYTGLTSVPEESSNFINAAEGYQQYACHPLFMFGLRNAALQTGIGRPRELLFLDLYFGLLASGRDPNFTGRHLFWLGLRVVDIIHTFYSRAVIQRQIDVSPAFMEFGLAKKDCGLSTCKP